MIAGTIIDIYSGRTDINTYAYNLSKNVYSYPIYGVWRSQFDHCIAMAVYCPTLTEDKRELLEILDICNLFEEKALNNLIVDFIYCLYISDRYTTIPLNNIEGDWYYVKLDDKVMMISSERYFNYGCTVYCLGLFIRDKTFLSELWSPYSVINSQTDTNIVKEWVSNLLNNKETVGIDLTLDELVKGAGKRTEIIRGVLIPNNISKIEIKFLGHTRYELEQEELYALSLLIGRKNYIPFGNALNIRKIDAITYNCSYETNE